MKSLDIDCDGDLCRVSCLPPRSGGSLVLLILVGVAFVLTWGRASAADGRLVEAILPTIVLALLTGRMIYTDFLKLEEFWVRRGPGRLPPKAFCFEASALRAVQWREGPEWCVTLDTRAGKYRFGRSLRAAEAQELAERLSAFCGRPIAFEKQGPLRSHAG